MSLLRCAIAGLLVAAAAGAAAHSYPARPVRVIVPVGPGGGLDFIARLVAPKLGDALNQSVVVDNRTGASGNIGVELAAQAAPDGHTLLFLSASSVASAAGGKTGFDLVRDFAPVLLTSALPTVLVAHAAVPAQNIAELVAYAKANPGKLNYGSTGNGTILHLAGALFGLATGTDLVHVPYKSVAASSVDLLAGRIQINFGGLATVLPHVKAGRLRLLAVTSQRRLKVLPDLPTMVESGLPSLVITQWHGVLAPAAVPRPVLERLHRELAAIMRQPATVARLDETGIDAIGSTPQEFAAYLKADLQRWTDVIRRTGIRID